MSEVLVLRSGGVLEVCLDRAAKKNALTGAMYATLIEALVSAGADAAIRAVLVTAKGETFCAGNDIMDFLQASQGQGDFESAAAPRFI
ncbi:MAG: enoyl-CoA hydratase-related protein, partial [Polyangiaceae bacterium]